MRPPTPLPPPKTQSPQSITSVADETRRLHEAYGVAIDAWEDPANGGRARALAFLGRVGATAGIVGVTSDWVTRVADVLATGSDAEIVDLVRELRERGETPSGLELVLRVPGSIAPVVLPLNVEMTVISPLSTAVSVDSGSQAVIDAGSSNISQRSTVGLTLAPATAVIKEVLAAGGMWSVLATAATGVADPLGAAALAAESTETSAARADEWVLTVGTTLDLALAGTTEAPRADPTLAPLPIGRFQLGARETEAAEGPDACTEIGGDWKQKSDGDWECATGWHIAKNVCATLVPGPASEEDLASESEAVRTETGVNYLPPKLPSTGANGTASAPREDYSALGLPAWYGDTWGSARFKQPLAGLPLGAFGSAPGGVSLVNPPFGCFPLGEPFEVAFLRPNQGDGVKLSGVVSSDVEVRSRGTVYRYDVIPLDGSTLPSDGIGVPPLLPVGGSDERLDNHPDGSPWREYADPAVLDPLPAIRFAGDIFSTALDLTGGTLVAPRSDPVATSLGWVFVAGGLVALAASVPPGRLAWDVAHTAKRNDLAELDDEEYRGSDAGDGPSTNATVEGDDSPGDLVREGQWRADRHGSGRLTPPLFSSATASRQDSAGETWSALSGRGSGHARLATGMRTMHPARGRTQDARYRSQMPTAGLRGYGVSEAPSSIAPLPQGCPAAPGSYYAESSAPALSLAGTDASYEVRRIMGGEAGGGAPPGR